MLDAELQTALHVAEAKLKNASLVDGLLPTRLRYFYGKLLGQPGLILPQASRPAGP